jgi:hypothetical protein
MNLIIKENINLLIFAFLASVFIYGIDIFNFYLPIDSEFGNNFIGTISLGRWGHSLLRYTILPEPFLPYFTVLISMVFLSISAVISSSVIGFEGKSSYLFCLLAVSYPQNAYQVEFLNQADTYCIGLALCSLSVKLFIQFLNVEEKVTRLSLASAAVALIIYAMAIYQTMVFYVICLYIAKIIYDNLENQKPILKTRANIIFIILIFTSLLLYLTITSIIQSFFRIPASTYGKIYFPHIFDIHSVYPTLRIFLKTALGSRNFGLQVNIFSVISSIILIKIAGSNKHNINRLPLTICLIIILFLPYSFILISMGEVPARLFCGSSIVFAFVIALLYQKLKYDLVILTICLLISIINIYSVTSLFYSDIYSRELDINTANNINSLISKNYPDILQSNIPVYFHGGLKQNNPWKKNKTDVSGSSFFYWDGGNNDRIINFFKFYGIENFHQAAPDQIKGLLPIINNIPEYPSRGSVKIVDGVLVIKLGQTTGWLPFEHK